VCVCVCVFVRACVCVCVLVHWCVSVSMYTYIHTHIYVQRETARQSERERCIHTHTCIYIYSSAIPVSSPLRIVGCNNGRGGGNFSKVKRSVGKCVGTRKRLFSGFSWNPPPWLHPSVYGVATISRLLKIIGLFRRISSLL